MNEDLERDLRAALRDRADRAEWTADLGPAAIDRSRKIKRRRAAMSAAAAAAVVAVAVPVAVYAATGRLDTTPPVSTQTPTMTTASTSTAITPTTTPPSASAPLTPPPRTSTSTSTADSAEPRTSDATDKQTGPVRQRLDLAALKRGEAPSIPYLEDRRIVDGDRVIAVANSDGTLGQFAVAGQGAVAIRHIGDSNPLEVLDADGRTTREFADVRDLRVSADGSTLGFVTAEFTESGSTKPGTTVYHRAASGTFRSLRIPTAYDAQVHAVIGTTVYLSYESSPTDNNGGELRSWVAGSSRTTRVATVPWPTALSGDGELAATLRSMTDFGSCSALVEVSGGNERWDTCDHQVREIAPDARTGALLRDWNGVPVLAQRYEDADHVLLIAEDDGKSAIVRCTISTGNCELARPLVTGTSMEGTDKYRLTS